MSVHGITFDTGVLVALERRSQRAWSIYRAAMLANVQVNVPTPVIAEWWRARSDVRDMIRSGLTIEPLSESVARLAGEAIAAVAGAGVIDAIVMASAAARGDVTYTGDFDDFERLRTFFPSVRVLSI